MILVHMKLIREIILQKGKKILLVEGKSAREALHTSVHILPCMLRVLHRAIYNYYIDCTQLLHNNNNRAAVCPEAILTSATVVWAVVVLRALW